MHQMLFFNVTIFLFSSFQLSNVSFNFSASSGSWEFYSQGSKSLLRLPCSCDIHFPTYLDSHSFYKRFILSYLLSSAFIFTILFSGIWFFAAVFTPNVYYVLFYVLCFELLFMTGRIGTLLPPSYIPCFYLFLYSLSYFSIKSTFRRDMFLQFYQVWNTCYLSSFTHIIIPICNSAPTLNAIWFFLHAVL